MQKYPAQPTSILHTTNFKKLNPSVLAYIHYPQVVAPNQLLAAIQKLSLTLPQIFCKYNASDNTFSPAVKEAKDILHQLSATDSPYDYPLDFQNGPQLNVFYRPLKEGCELYFLESHIFADGAGLKQVVYALIKLINDSNSQLSKNHLDNGEILEQFKDYDLNEFQRKDAEPYEMTLPFPTRLENEPEFYDVHHVTLSEPEFLKLHETAKAHHLTLNDVILASYMRMLKHYNQDAPEIALACPTDTRQFLPESLKASLHVGNYTARYNPRVDVSTTETLLESAKKVHVEMDLLKEHHQFLQSVLPLYLHAPHATVEELRNDARKNYHVRSISYTNMAIFDVTKLAIGQNIPTAAFTSGAFRRAPLYQICFGSFNNQLNIVCNVIGTAHQQMYAKKLANEVKADLTTLK